MPHGDGSGAGFALAVAVVRQKGGDPAVRLHVSVKGPRAKIACSPCTELFCWG